MKHLLLIIIGLVFLFSACSKDNPTEPGNKNSSGKVYVTDNIKEKPAYISLATMQPVNTFDLMFINEERTLEIRLNGGTSGSAGVSAKILGEVGFDEEANIDSGFTTDNSAGKVIGESWYIYEFNTHSIYSKEEVYLVKASDYKTYKFMVDDFDGEKYFVTFGEVDETGKPTGKKSVEILATAEKPGLLSFAEGNVLEKDEWDIGFVAIPIFIPEMGASMLNPAARINSIFGVEVAEVSDSAFENIKSVPSGLIYKKDESDSLAVGTSILNYNPENHVLTPPNVVYIIKTVEGKHAKVKVESYYHPDTAVSGFVNFQAELLD